MCATTSPGLLTVWIRAPILFAAAAQAPGAKPTGARHTGLFALQGFNQFRAPTIARQKPL